MEKIALIALVVGALVRLVKTDKLDEVLESLGLPAIPKRALPWISVGLGAALAVLDAKVSGASWMQAATAALDGIISGAMASAGHDMLVPVAPSLVGSKAK